MTKSDTSAAARVLTAACREAVRQIRAGETRYVIVLVAATETAGLLLDGVA